MKKLLLRLLELLERGCEYKTGARAPISGIWRSGKQYIPLSKGERFPPCINDWWILVVSV